MNRNYNSGKQSPVVVPEKAADHYSRFNCFPRSVSVESPVVVPEKAADHYSRFNPQIYISQRGIKTLSPENGSHIKFIADLGGSTADSVSNPTGV